MGVSPGGYLIISSNTIKYGHRDNFKPVKISEGSYFVLGDNRDWSYDSRFWGPVPKENIKGKISLRIYPFGRFGRVK